MLKVFIEGLRIRMISVGGIEIGSFDYTGLSHVAFSDGTAVKFMSGRCEIIQKGVSFITIETDAEVLGDTLFVGRDIKWVICGDCIDRGYKIPWP